MLPGLKKGKRPTGNVAPGAGFPSPSRALNVELSVDQVNTQRSTTLGCCIAKDNVHGKGV
jgi:hypothetical protein